MVKKAKKTKLAGRSLARESNRAILDDVLGHHYDDDKELDDLGYDNPPARLGLTKQLRDRGVPVDPAVIDRASTVGDVHKHMNKVKPGWAP